MLNAFKEAGKTPQKGHYSFRRANNTPLALPKIQLPLVYYLFGHHEDLRSLVLTEADLIDFLVKIVGGDPPVPVQVRSILKDPASSFLFLGFGFHNWYLRVLLKVMDVHGHHNKAIAFEDAQFFDLPESKQAVAFFTHDRRIDFRELRWEPFARQLREAYEASLPLPTTEPTAVPVSLASNAPRAFVSYASENRADVDELAEKLEMRGIRIWRDKQDLRPGERWNEVLFKVIKKDVDYVIVVQTPAMKKRIEGVFHKEITAAKEREAGMGESEKGQKLLFLFPVTIGPCAPLSSLTDWHTIDVSNADGVDSLVNAILKDWENRAALTFRPERVA
jgi:hypothetical protein